MNAAILRHVAFFCFTIAPFVLHPSVCPAQTLKRGLFVGNETYDEEQLPKLKCPEDDARDLAAEFENLGFATTTMTSDANNARLRPTTPAKILDQVEETLKNLGENDTFVFSLSGHGVNFKDEDLLASGVRETYFCPTDANLEKRGTLLPLSKLIEIIDRSACGRKLVLIDCCREELAIPAQDITRAALGQRQELEPVYENERAVPRGMEVIFSCSSKERSWEFGDLGESGHGVFTYFVLEYLRGNAPSDFYHRGELTIDSLVLYARSNTADYVFQKKSRSQTPVRRGGGTDWPLGKLLLRNYTNEIGMRFVLIPAGKFKTEPPAARIKLPSNEIQITRAYYMGVYEVTQHQYEQIMDENPSAYAKTGSHSDRVKDMDTSEFPVENVSWYDAVLFCNALSEKEQLEPVYELRNIERVDERIANADVSISKSAKGYRLPTEAQWEHACRAGTTTPFHFGSQLNGLQANCNGTYPYGTQMKGKYLDRTTKVGSYRPNAFGLYDMHGNVWEWCQDVMGEDYLAKSELKDPQGPPPDGTIPGSVRVFRGGSSQFHANICQSGSRNAWLPERGELNGGFRVARQP